MTRLELAQALRRTRLLAGITQREMAAKLGMSQAAISAYELGGNEPGIETISAWAQACGTHLHLVIGDEASIESFPIPQEAREDMARLLRAMTRIDPAVRRTLIRVAEAEFEAAEAAAKTKAKPGSSE